MWEGIKKWFNETALPWLGEKAKELAGKAVDWIVQAAKDAPGKLGEFLGTVSNWIINDFLPMLATKTGELVGGFLKWASDAAIDLLPKLAHFAGEFVGWTIKFIADLPGNMAEAAGAILKWVAQAIIDAPGKLAEFKDKFIEFVKDLPGKLIEAGGNALEWLKNMGKDVLTGLLNGIKDKIGEIPGLVSEIFGEFWNGLTSKFKMGSPSRLMATAGGHIMDGLTIGILKGQKDAQAAWAAATDFAPPNVAAAGLVARSGLTGALAASDTAAGNGVGPATTFNIYEASDPAETADLVDARIAWRLARV